VVLCALVSLDGDGSTTYIITIAAPAALQGYDMNRLYPSVSDGDERDDEPALGRADRVRPAR
jgi:hypothetical protein